MGDVELRPWGVAVQACDNARAEDGQPDAGLARAVGRVRAVLVEGVVDLMADDEDF